MTTALDKAIREEGARRKASFAELAKLENIVHDKALSNVTKQALSSILDEDATRTTALNEAIKGFTASSFPLKFNKFKEIISCSRNLLESSFESAIAGTLTTTYPFNPNERTIHYGTEANQLGTSQPNCIQNLYLVILRAVYNIASFSELKELQETGIYDPNLSPNIQTVELPVEFNSEHYKNWFYYYKDGQSPKQGELVIPNLGYAFGGSRYHLRYQNKAFKTEDCSSSVAKWVGAKQPFTTSAMISFYKSEPSCHSNELCEAASQSLIPIKQDISTISAGSIFVFPSHTGIVTNNFPEESLIETISYNRDMPQLEGLGYHNYSYTDKNFYFFEARPHIIHPNGYIQAINISGKLGTKTSLLQEANSSQFVLSLIDGTLVNEGGIITNNGKVLEDTQTANKDQHRLLKKGRDITNENPTFFPGKLAVISSPGQENWYHFLLQVLPRLKILKESGEEFDRIYINNLQFQFQHEALNHILEVLQIPREKIWKVNGDAIIQANTLIVPSVPFIPIKDRTLPDWLREFLRNSFLSNDSPNEQLIAEKIYISREKAKTRHITNEKDLTNYLEQKGFKIVNLEDFSPFDQAYLFNNAKIIVGPHGSGFTNLVFARPRTKVIEIDHSADEIRSFYMLFSEIMNCTYSPFYVDHVTDDHLEDDMYVNLPEFIRHLDGSIEPVGETLFSDHL